MRSHPECRRLFPDHTEFRRRGGTPLPQTPVEPTRVASGQDADKASTARTPTRPLGKAKYVILAAFMVAALAGGTWCASRSSTQANPAHPTARANPKDGLRHVWIPAGSFRMGCSPGDNECSPEEGPAHRVTISKGFWLGQTEVTVGAYRRFASATGRDMPPEPKFQSTPLNLGWSNEQMPVVNVTWDDARAYCTWAGGRLPTEAEWEYAARGGRSQVRYGPLDQIAWYRGNSRDSFHEVGQKRPNGFGLFDMLGNVWEWVSDRDDWTYYRNSPGIDPPGPSSGEWRILRGGSWNGYPSIVRVSLRRGHPPDHPGIAFGLRCVHEVDSP